MGLNIFGSGSGVGCRTELAEAVLVCSGLGVSKSHGVSIGVLQDWVLLILGLVIGALLVPTASGFGAARKQLRSALCRCDCCAHRSGAREIDLNDLSDLESLASESWDSVIVSPARRQRVDGVTRNRAHRSYPVHGR